MSKANKIIVLANFERALTVTCLAIGIPILIAVAYFALGIIAPPDIDAEIEKTKKVLSWHGGEGRVLGEPSQEQRARAQAIFDSWRNASPSKRSLGAADLVAGKVLIGRSRLELVENLGSAASEMTVPPNQLGYDVSGFDGFRWIIIKLDNETVVDAYVTAR
jgi:hypothetical protein